MSATLKKIVLLLFILLVLQDCILALRREFPTCRSRDTCIRLTNCLPYMNLIRSLKKPLTRAAVLFLRKQECGFDGTYPMVCCFPSNTRRTQGTRFNSFEDKGFSTKPPTYYVPTFQDNQYNIEEQHKDIYYKPLKKPDFTPSDLSDYRPFKVPDAPTVPISTIPDEGLSPETSSPKPKSTTEKVQTTTTRLFKRKPSNVYSGDYTNKVTTIRPMQLTQSEKARNKKAEEMKKKMEAINQAFLHLTMDDYFFVRRMDNEKNRKTNS